MASGDDRRVSLTPAQLAASFLQARVGFSVIELVDPADPDTWVIRANNPAASLNSQVDLAHVVGRRFLEAFPAVRDTPFIDWYREVHASGEARELPEISYGDAQVPEAAFRVWLEPLPGGCVLGQYVNVTLQRRAEGRLRALNASLEAQVADRTAKLAASRRMLREMTYAAAHDLQTPLRHILYLSDPDVDETTPPVDRDPLAQVHRAASVMHRRLAGLLHFTSAEQVDAPRPLDLAAELDRVERGLEALLATSGGRIERAVPATRVAVSPRALRTALERLVENALVFHEAGSAPRVKVAAAVEGSELVVIVRDAGIGIDPKYHGSIFGAFYRVHGGERFPGVGVGLSVARVAVEAAGGRIEVDSAPDRGAAFTVYLPVAPVAG